MPWGESIVSGVLAASVVVGATALAGVYGGKTWQEQAGYVNPSCDSPKGLSQIPRDDLRATDNVGQRANDDHVPSKAMDGYSGSIWLPHAEPSQAGASRYVAYFGADKSTLSITLEAEIDVRLICVNNGLGSGDARYENWGKVRTVRVWRDDRPQQSQDVVLSAQPLEFSERLQEAGTGPGPAKVVHLQVLNAYAGEGNVSHDPDICKALIDAALQRIHPDGARPNESKERFVKRVFEEKYATVGGIQPRYEEGCQQSPSPLAGLSEVVLYQRNPNDPPPGWLPFGPW